MYYCDGAEHKLATVESKAQLAVSVDHDSDIGFLVKQLHVCLAIAFISWSARVVSNADMMLL